MDDSSDIFYLETLIDALDRRRPQPERPDFVRIARDGAVLRQRALRRLAELRAKPAASTWRH